MKTKSKFYSKGFSLVELSIVLVILGLLVVGVIGGARLIDGARVNKIVSEINEIRRATSIFQTTYDGLPGDIATVPTEINTTTLGATLGIPTAANGDGDGLVDDFVAGNFGNYSTGTTAGSASESNHVFRMLAAAQLYPGTYTVGTSTTQYSVAVSSVNGGNAPASSAYRSNSVFLVTSLQGSAPATTAGSAFSTTLPNNTNVIVLTASGTPSTTATTAANAMATLYGGAIPMKIARGVDSRIDDGRALTGAIVAASTASTNCGSGTAPGASNAGALPKLTDASTVGATNYPGSTDDRLDCVLISRL